MGRHLRFCALLACSAAARAAAARSRALGASHRAASEAAEAASHRLPLAASPAAHRLPLALVMAAAAGAGAFPSEAHRGAAPLVERPAQMSPGPASSAPLLGAEAREARKAREARQPSRARDEPEATQPYWLPALRALVGGDLLEKPGGGLRFELFSSGKRKLDVEVVEVGGRLGRSVALDAVQAYEACGGGDVVALVRAASDLSPRQVVLPASSEGAGAVFLFAEGGEADLSDVLHERGIIAIPPSVRLSIVVEVLRGLRQMELAGFMHRAVDPRNIKVVEGWASGTGRSAKLGGLAFAAPQARGPAGAWGAQPAYVAPEVWAGSSSVRKADVWSAGVLAYALFVGGVPAGLEGFEGQGPPDLANHPLGDYVTKEFSLDQDARFQTFAEQDPEMGQLIHGMLRRNTLLRPSIRRALRATTRMAKSRGIVVPAPRTVQGARG